MNLLELKQEIDLDPELIGYKNGSSWKKDDEITNLLNDKSKGEIITRKFIKPSEIFDSIPYSEYSSYTVAKRQYIESLLSISSDGGVINANDEVIYQNLLDLFPQGSEARSNILAKIRRQGSRAEVIWGENVKITKLLVGRAAKI